jgi:hypothetical protein
MLGVVLMVYSFYEVDETLEIVQKNKNRLQAKLYNFSTSGEKLIEEKNNRINGF